MHHYLPASLTDQVRSLREQLERAGVNAVDMQRAGSLELDVAIPQFMRPDLPAVPGEIALMEGEIAALPVPSASRSQFRWFVDGAQKTLPVWLVGTTPIVAAIATVAVAERDDAGVIQLVGETLTERISWLIPRHTTNREVDTVVGILEERGAVIIDPLQQWAMEPSIYLGHAQDFGRYLGHVHRAAGKIRSVIEQRTIELWDETIRPTSANGWLVIDGQMPGRYQRAIGLVKAPNRLYLSGEDIETVFRLAQGERTSAFLLQDGTEDDDEVPAISRPNLTMWYQRLWKQSGYDVRQGLVRIEAAADVRQSGEFDEIAGWLHAERVPRATTDARWSTLLYPIHLLEKMLKRRIESITAGWPA